MEIEFKFELGSFVKAAQGLVDRESGAMIIQDKKEKYAVMGRAYTEGVQGAVVSSAIIYYVTPKHHKMLFAKDKAKAPTIYTVKESDLTEWKSDNEDVAPNGL